MPYSRQIRPPIYSLKQSKLRKRRVIRFAILYFGMLVIFLALIIGPVIAKRFVTIPGGIPMDLLQPTGQNNNDTLGTSQTGTALLGGAVATGGGGGGGGGKGNSKGDSNGGGDGGGGGGGAAKTTSPFDRAKYV